MPIKISENINSKSGWVLWEIKETLEEMMYALPLTRLEMNELDGITNFYKKKEWLAGRLSVKALLDGHSIPYKGIYKDSHGKPYLIDDACHISIANSYPYAAAIFHDDEPVGIDIENPREKLRALAVKFLNEKEQENAGENLQKLCLYWCGKETLYKIYGRKQLSFRQHMTFENFDLQPHGYLNGRIVIHGSYEKQYDICYHVLNDLIIAYNF